MSSVPYTQRKRTSDETEVHKNRDAEQAAWRVLGSRLTAVRSKGDWMMLPLSPALVYSRRGHPLDCARNHVQFPDSRRGKAPGWGV